MNMHKKISVIILGAGGRGTIYANLIRLMPEKAEVVAVAEPRDFFRNRITMEHNIPEVNSFTDWHDVLKRPKFADAVIITTQDRMHVEPAVAFADKGYNILIEKPLAPDASSCRRIVEAVKKNNVLLSACHVMRYANYTSMLRDLIRNGSVGQIVSIEHLEPVGHWRYAHSYVRGNWNREETSSSVLLAKSIHDLDWINFIVGRRCRSISSFGSLMFFRRENRPEGAAERCLDCPLEPSCPYSAPRFYLERWKSGHIDNYIESVTSPLTEENILKAMREGPYGRCVFACDNDVADHQVVNMLFEGGKTAQLTMTAFSKDFRRTIKVHLTGGEIMGDIAANRIDYTAWGRETVTIDVTKLADDLTHHCGGDKLLVRDFYDYICGNPSGKGLTAVGNSLESHLMAFAAEKSRLSGGEPVQIGK